MTSPVTTLYPAWKETVRVLLSEGLTFGSNITRERLITLCGISPATSIEDKDRFDLEVLQAIVSIKKALLHDHCMLMFSTRDGSYTIAHPESQTDLAIEVGRKSMRKAIEKMADSVTCIRADLLTHVERTKNTDAQAKISQLGGMVRAQVARLT